MIHGVAFTTTAVLRKKQLLCLCGNDAAILRTGIQGSWEEKPSISDPSPALSSAALRYQDKNDAGQGSEQKFGMK